MCRQRLEKKYVIGFVSGSSLSQNQLHPDLSAVGS